MRMTGFIRVYCGYDLFRDDEASGEVWYATPSTPLPGDDEALVTYPDEAALCADINATFAVPGAAS